MVRTIVSDIYFFKLKKKKEAIFSAASIEKGSWPLTRCFSKAHSNKKRKKKMPAVIFFEEEWEQYHRGVIHASRLIMI